jgi:hypothetical protein
MFTYQYLFFKKNKKINLFINLLLTYYRKTFHIILIVGKDHNLSNYQILLFICKHKKKSELFIKIMNKLLR